MTIIPRVLLLAAALSSAGCVTYYAEEPKTVVGDYLSAQFAARTQDIASAADRYTKVHAAAPGAEAVLRDAFFYQLAAGETEAAFSLAQELVAKEADDGLALMILASREIKRGQYPRARTLLRDGVDTEFLAATANIVHGWSVVGMDGARAGLESIKARSSEEFQGFYPFHQANLLEAIGDEAGARSAYRLSTTAFSGSVSYLAYGSFLERTGATSDAFAFYSAIVNEPGGVREAAKRGLARLEAGRAPGDFEQLSPEKGAAIAYFALGRAILQQSESQRIAAERAGFRVTLSNYNLPLALIRTALYLDPEFDDARMLTGRILNVYGTHESAIAEFRKVGKKSPFYPEARASIASGLAALERDDAAIDVLEATISAAEDPRDLQFSLASLLSTRERYADAVAVMDELIDGLSDDDATVSAWRYYILRGDARLRMENWPGAVADLQKAYELAPEEPTTLNYLGYSWAERGENLEEAFKLIEKAIELNPSSGAIIDSLGWAHYQLGDYEEAIGHLEQAASLEPSDPTITDHLGDTYWRLGRKIEARYEWRRVLELEPTEKLSAAVRGKLRDGLPALDKSASDETDRDE